MEFAVPSRFACLRIEDDDFRPPSSKAGTKKKSDKQSNAKKQDKSSQQSNNAKKTSNKQPKNNKKPKQKQQNTEQWEEWKAKDSELVDGTFEEDLQNAILASKLDYEEKKDLYKQHEKEATTRKDEVSGKKKKKKVMSLEQFLEGEKKDTPEKPVLEDLKFDENRFFEQVQKDVKQELTKEKVLQTRRQREANFEETITIAQYQEKLEREIEQNAILQVKLETAMLEIKDLKSKNTSLYNILKQGEMKDKGHMIVELNRLTTVKNELTEEVTRLTGLLEQERSKVAALLSDSHNKQKHKKKTQDA